MRINNENINKIVGVILCIILVIGVCIAKADIETVTLYWDWDGPTPESSGLDSADPIANDLQWRLYMRDENGTYQEPIISVPYNELFEITHEITIDGLPGSVATKYFVLRAFYNGGESENSNELSKEFFIPRAAPLHLRFTVIK